VNLTYSFPSMRHLKVAIYLAQAMFIEKGDVHDEMRVIMTVHHQKNDFGDSC